MKKKGIKAMKKRFFTLIIAIAMVVSATLTLYIPARATGPSCGANDIYYFSDSAPIVDETTLAWSYPTRTITYDIKYFISSLSLSNLYTTGYFNNIGSGCVVIFEIKTCMQGPNVLLDIFEKLDYNGCTVVFVSSAPEYEYADPYFNDYVDRFMECDPHRYQYFVEDFVNHLVNDQQFNADDGFSILLDSRFTGIYSYNILGDNTSIADLVNASAFLNCLIGELCQEMGLSPADDTAWSGLQALHNSDIHLLVDHYQTTVYVDLASRVSYLFGNAFGHPQFHPNYTSLPNETNIVALGIWSLPDVTYNLWYNIQNCAGGYPEEWEGLPVYVLEEEEINYTSNGLIILDEEDIKDEEDTTTPPPPSQDHDDLLQLLAGLIN